MDDYESKVLDELATIRRAVVALAILAGVGATAGVVAWLSTTG